MTGSEEIAKSTDQKTADNIERYPRIEETDKHFERQSQRRKSASFEGEGRDTEWPCMRHQSR